MAKFDYEVALNKLNVGKEKKINLNIAYDKIPSWVSNEDFFKLFLPYLKIIGDSREQDKWISEACKYYGICFEWVKKDKEKKTENLKEGDYTFQVIFKNVCYDYTNVVAYERKGSIVELYNNCSGRNENGKNDRERVKREFERFQEKKYKKVVLLLEVGESLTDLINVSFSYRTEGGLLITKNVKNTIYATLMSWKQPNNKGFEIIQSNNHKKLFWQFLLDCYYFFRNEIRNQIQILDGGIDGKD